jgi:DNA-binding NarL/FixJ family response regulator
VSSESQARSDCAPLLYSTNAKPSVELRSQSLRINSEERFKGLMGQMRLRVVVADDNPNILEKLVSLLEVDFEVVRTAREGKSALKTTMACKPDVVVLDLQMPGLNAIEIVKELMKYDPSPAVVICSAEKDLEIVHAALKAGALGYVFKTRATRDLNLAVKSVALGRSFVSVD